MRRSSIAMGTALFFSMVSLGISGIPEAYADSSTVYNLDEVVVTATRTEKDILKAPANTQVITQEDIKKKGYLNVYELIRDETLSQTNGWSDEGDDYGGMQSAMRIRGLDSGTLLMINGVPANFGNAAVMNAVPMEQIERVEIVKGANSTLYGPQAMAGVINVITKKPGDNVGYHGTVWGSIGNRFKETGINLNMPSVNLGIKKSWTADHNDVVKETQVGPNISIHDKHNYQFYGDVQVAPNLTVNFGRADYNSSYINGNHINYKPTWSYKGLYHSIYDNYSVVYDNPQNGWKITGGYDRMAIAGTYDKSYPRYRDANRYKSYNLDLDIQKQFLLNEKKDSLILGFDVSRENYEASYGAAGMPKQKNGRNSFSFYQSYDHAFNDAFDLIMGLREYHMGSSRAQKSDTEYLPQFQGLYKLNDRNSLYFNIGKAFEMQKANAQFNWGSNYALNPNLKPQTGWTYEFGYKGHDDKRFWTADVFYMDIKNKFAWARTPDTNQNNLVNQDTWKNYGLELTYKQIVNRNWNYSLGATLNNPKAKSNGVTKQDSPKYILNVGMGYHEGKFDADLRIFSYLKREGAGYTRLGRYNSGKPDHYLKDSCDVAMTLTYSPSKNDTFRLIGRNLLNRKDVVNYSEYYTTPINYVLTYERHF